VSALNLILIGPPGAGKGTQAENIKEDFDLPYLATGDMMRAKRKEDSDLGRKIDKIINEGGLVDDDIVCEVLIERIDSEGQDGFLLDGFPRTQGQADILDRALSKRGRSLTAVLLIEAPDETIVSRLTGRRQCPDGHVYHLEFNPPEEEGVCDIDGKELEQRDDDKPETVEKRLATYHEQTEPLVERYEDEGLLRRFDGTQDPDEVHEHLRRTIKTIQHEEDV
jgi:adenylate kinase